MSSYCVRTLEMPNSLNSIENSRSADGMARKVVVVVVVVVVVGGILAFYRRRWEWAHSQMWLGDDVRLVIAMSSLVPFTASHRIAAPAPAARHCHRCTADPHLTSLPFDSSSSPHHYSYCRPLFFLCQNIHLLSFLRSPRQSICCAVNSPVSEQLPTGPQVNIHRQSQLRRRLRLIQGLPKYRLPPKHP